MLLATSVMAAAVASTATAASSAAALRQDLAPTGTLRAGINYNNALLARRDPATGELSGLAVDLTRELARRVGVPVQLVPYDAAGKMSAAAASGAWDIAYFAIDPARAADIDYTGAHIQLEGAYLVPPGSPLRKVEEVDRDGVRIAVTTGSAYDLYLSRELKHARIVHAENTPASFELMMKDKLDAVAAVRTAAVAGARQIAGARVLDGHFMVIPQAAALPKGRPAATRYVREFIEEMKASGFVAAALARHGFGPDDASVAPPAMGNAVQTATYLEVLPAGRRAAAALVAEYARAAAVAPGNIGVQSLVEAGRGNRFVLVESWWDQAAYALHQSAAYARDFRAKFHAQQSAPLDTRVNRSFAVDAWPPAAGASAVSVVTHVDVPGPRREEAERLLKSLQAASRKDPGNLRYDVYQQAEPRSNHFTVYAVWDSQRAFEASAGTPHGRKFREELAPMLGALYDERLYKPVGTR